MTFLATQPLEQRQAAQILTQTPSDPKAFEPGFFQGLPAAAGTGVGRVLGVANQIGGEIMYGLGAPLIGAPLDYLFDTQITGFMQDEFRDKPAQLTRSMTPDPATTGTAGNILYGLVGIGVPAAVGTYFGGPAGGAALAGGFTSVGTYTDLTGQGVDPTTATEAALFEGSMVGASVVMPMALGGRVGFNALAYGPGINVATGVAMRAGTGELLESRGYTDMAQHYVALDAEMMAIDATLGSFFGYVGARQARQPARTFDAFQPRDARTADAVNWHETSARDGGQTGVAEDGMTIVHGSGRADLGLDAIEIVRDGQKQGKKGRKYGGFYGAAVEDAADAVGYAEMMGGTPTLYDVNIKPGTKVFHKDGDITRLSEKLINELVADGYGVVVGKDPRGRTEYAVIDKGAIESVTPRRTVRPATHADVDAAHTALDRRHVELDTAPGAPANHATLQAHVRNLQAATEALLDGRPVEVERTDATFVPKPANPAYADNVLTRAFRESGLPELMDEVANLEAELARRGRVVHEEPLPDLAAALDRLEQRGGKLGHVTDVKVGEDYAAARWAVMEADEVAPTVAVSENQLRDRTRMASQLQIDEIAAKLDPRLLLADVPTMDHGAPTLTADGQVVAGNGRALAIQKAYAGERGAAYREALLATADRYGLAPGEIEGMRNPVLVRVLQQGVDVERAAILSNEGGAMRMSGLEQARVDAGRLPSLAGVEVPESGDFTAATLRDYVRGWVQQFPAGQRAALVDAEGQLSQEGMTRLRNAVLYRAYGDSPTLQRLVESTDPGARNVAQALTRAAPKVAEVKDAIARGELHPLDISDAIVRTADLNEQIRAQGMTVDTWLAQLDMFNPGEAADVLALLRFVDANKRSARAITDLLNTYYDGVIAAGHPGQGDMLGGAAPDQVTLLSNAIAQASPAKGAEIVQDTLFRPARAAEEVRPEAALRRAEMDVDGWGMPTPARTLLDGDPLLQPRHTDATPERAAMREALIEERFAGAVPAEGKPIAIVLGGGGASGKGTILKKLRAIGAVPKGAIELDPDGFKIKIPEYRQIIDAGDSRAAAVTHEESSMIFKAATDRAVAGKYHVVLDRTLGDPAKGLAELQRLKDAGYEVRLIGVTVDPASAIGRAAERAKGKDKRTVPVDALLKAHKGFAQAFEQYAAVADRAMLFDNEVAKGQDARPIATGGAGKALTALDKNAYAEFARKGGLNEHAQDQSSLYGPVGRDDGADRAGGTLARPDAGGSGQAGRRGGSRGTGEVGASQGAHAVPPGLDPQPILAARPDLAVIDDAGNPAYAADALAEADTAIARSQTDALGFEAAVNCFLRSAA